MFCFYRRECHGYSEDDGILHSSKGRFSKIDIIGLSRFRRRGCMASGSELGQVSGLLVLKVLVCLFRSGMEYIYWKLGELPDCEPLINILRQELRSQRSTGPRKSA